jgi:hypothetical protein
MGTMSEWMHALVAGGIFGMLMFLWELFMRRDSATKWPNVASLVLISLAWGMMMIFGWRVLHGGLLAVFVLAVLGLFALGIIERRAQKRRLSSN